MPIATQSFVDNWRVAVVNSAINDEAESALFRKDVGLLSVLRQPANIEASIFNLSDANFNENGKYKEVAVTYRPLKSPSFESKDANEWLAPTATGGTAQKPKLKKFGIELRHQSDNLLLDGSVLNNINEGSQVFFTPQMSEHLRNFIAEIGNMVSNRVMSGGFVGKFPKVRTDMADSARAAFKDLPLFNADKKTINYIGEEILAADMDDMSYNGAFYKVGGRWTRTYKRILGLTSAADTGIDAGLRDAVGNWYEDRGLSTYAYGNASKPLLAFSAGALQFVSWSHRKDDFIIDKENHKRLEVIEPYFGIPITMIWNEDYTGDELKTYVRYEAYFDVIGLKDIEWTDNPAYDGVNGVVAYDIVAADTDIDSIEEWNVKQMELTTTEISTASDYEDADVNASAFATFVNLQRNIFTIASGTANNIDQLRINGGGYVFANVDGAGYDLATDAVAARADMETILAAFTNSELTTFDTTGDVMADLVIKMPTTVTSMKLGVVGGNNVSMAETSENIYEFDGSASKAASGQSTAEYKWDFGEFTIDYGAKATALTGVTGISGTYEKPVITAAKLAGVTSCTVYMKDSNNNIATYSFTISL